MRLIGGRVRACALRARFGCGAVLGCLLCKWAPLPSVPVPVPATRDRAPRPARGRRQGEDPGGASVGSARVGGGKRPRAPRPAGQTDWRTEGFHQPTSDSMAAIPSSGSLVATHDYYRRRLGSTSSNSSCGSAEYPGEAVPHHPGLPKADPGHWWASFFFGKSTLPFMATVLESPERPPNPCRLPPQNGTLSAAQRPAHLAAAPAGPPWA
uniref:Pancreatic progenitor cell differentiation and proliferation factor n=1 Tax=Suricata suricatta TaxID=37032 RepID=A0A673USS9_SURSU